MGLKGCVETNPVVRHATSGNARTRVIMTLAIVFTCFTMTSTSYLAWLYRLGDVVNPATADALSMVGGYALQSLGVGLVCLAMRLQWRPVGQTAFILVVAAHFVCAAAAISAQTFFGMVFFGMAMNLFCGAVSGFYLFTLARWVQPNRFGVTFGCGYACSIVATWLFSIALQGNSPGPAASMIICAVLSAGAIALVASIHRFGDITLHAADLSDGVLSAPSDACAGDFGGKSRTPLNADVAGSYTTGRDAAGSAGKASSQFQQSSDVSILVLASLTVVLLSLVKGVGFGFPSSDLAHGVSLESSRLFYALGLCVAGIIADRDRKHAAICCLAALVVPFGCLALSGEPVPSTVLWAVNYLFYGFFSVYRIVLFADIARESNRFWLSGFGLLFGRVGDALGACLCLVLVDSIIALVSVAAVLFAATVFAFYRIFQHLYLTQPEETMSAEEAFDRFAIRYALSVREREVLRLVLDELTNAEVAGRLFVTEGTVKFHVRNVLKKTDCKNRLELIAKYAEESRR